MRFILTLLLLAVIMVAGFGCVDADTSTDTTADADTGCEPPEEYKGVDHDAEVGVQSDSPYEECHRYVGTECEYFVCRRVGKTCEEFEQILTGNECE